MFKSRAAQEAGTAEDISFGEMAVSSVGSLEEWPYVRTRKFLQVPKEMLSSFI